MFKTIAKRLTPAPVQSFVRSQRRRWAMQRFAPRVVAHDYGGVRLQVSLADPLGAEWYDRDYPELPEIAFLRRHSLRPGARVFDLGAHQGVVALQLAAAVGEGGAVVALEASPHNARMAEQNAALNRAGNVRVLHAAIAAKAGTIAFNESFNGQVDGGAGTHGTIDVAARTVDDLAEAFGRPDVLFIDVEGFECEALRGAARTLAAGVDCFVEVHGGCGLEKFGGTVDGVLAYFPESRFDRFFCEEGGAFLPLAGRPGLDGRRWFLIAVQRGAAAPDR